MKAGQEYPPAELRDFLGVSRKYLIPLLEYCDRRGVTDRRVAGRALGGTGFASNTVRNGDIRSWHLPNPHHMFAKLAMTPVTSHQESCSTAP